MNSLDIGCGLRQLREPAEKRDYGQPSDPVAEEVEEKAPEEEKYILCRQCQQVITSPADRISVQGSHQHTFANPHGIVFEIGCFKTVVGMGYAGSASDEFSWFAGYRWQVGFCAMCLTHLGWLFIANSGDSFNGLILDRLLEPT
jgi:hypothetical protein